MKVEELRLGTLDETAHLKEVKKPPVRVVLPSHQEKLACFYRKHFPDLDIQDSPALKKRN
jgi:hypothetical protein